MAHEMGANLALVDLNNIYQGFVWMHMHPSQSTYVGVEWNEI
jgi:hypothetical protein